MVPVDVGAGFPHCFAWYCKHKLMMFSPSPMLYQVVSRRCCLSCYLTEYLGCRSLLAFAVVFPWHLLLLPTHVCHSMFAWCIHLAIERLLSCTVQVKNGKGQMPAWAESLSPEDIQAVAAYVYTQAEGNLWD